MILEINKEQVQSFDMSHFLPCLNDLYRKRFTSRKEHYKFLAWLATAYPSGRVLDLGTRAGASAMCFASNPDNDVISYDVSFEMRFKNNFDFSNYPNITFVKANAVTIPVKRFSQASLIMLDLLHHGNEEQQVLDLIEESNFKGILILDDIDFYKFPKMKDLWKRIDRPKWKISFAHHSGTGIVSYGPEIVLSGRGVNG